MIFISGRRLNQMEPKINSTPANNANNFQKSIIKKNEKKQANLKNQKNQNFDLESINISSATYVVLEQISKVISEMKTEIEKIKENMVIQEEEMVDKMKNALHQELTTILQ
jgi:hypothetical protein